MANSQGTRSMRLIQRFDRSQRLQHAVQILSFTTLCVTGLLQKFSDNDNAEAMIQLLGGVERLRFAHRATAIVFIAEAVYHALELGWRFAFRKMRLLMIPSLKDAKDALQMVKYFVGLAPERPQFDRFDFKQKTEYLALIWGSLVMIATGLMMWFPIQTTAIFPGEFIPAARVAHGGEALLAFLAILIWHMYGAHLSPDVFPFDKTIFTGTISEERMIHEHPLEYARIIAGASARVGAGRSSLPVAPTFQDSDFDDGEEVLEEVDYLDEETTSRHESHHR